MIRGNRMQRYERWVLIIVLFSIVAFGIALVPGTVAAQGDQFQTDIGSNSTSFSDEVVFSGLNSPLEVTFLPDGRILILQKNGRILIGDPSTRNATTYMSLEEINTTGERGLLGIALDPDFSQNGHFYVYYTGADNYNRISRFSHVENRGNLTSRGDLSSETEIWVNPDETDSCCHFGGGLGIGPDGKIYLTTGDEFRGSQSQNLTTANGKIIRINRDGSIPNENPFVDHSSALDEIWALGLRNPFTATWDTPTNRFYIGESGGNNHSIAQEDIHIGERGANYGWPDCQGYCDNPEYTDPIYTYPHNGSGSSVMAGTVYRGSQFPSDYRGALFYGDFVDGWIKYLTFDDSGDVAESHDFTTDAGSVVDIHQGPDGSLFYVDIMGGTVNRITATNTAPRITEASADPTSGVPPLNVTFNGSATDPNEDSLTYTWTFGDGTNATSPNTTHTYDESGVYTARLTVSDGNSTTVSDPVEIRVGEPPSATVTRPSNGSLFRAGDTIRFEGAATDPQDGTLTGDNLTWEVGFIHGEHTHPVLDGVNGTSGEFEIETSGHDYSGDTGYYISLTAVDSDGLTDTDRVEVYPDKVNLSLESKQDGVSLYLDSISRTTPYVHDTLINFTHTVRAPTTQCVDGTEYGFINWSDGGAATHAYTVPTNDTTLTAHYEPIGTCGETRSVGPVLQLTTDSGVNSSDSTVTGWADQSENGNDLRANGAPVLRSDATPSSMPAISFDGDDDELVRTATLNDFPTGSQDRTLFVVAKYDSTGSGGVSYGQDRCNQAFGAIVNGSGNLTVHGWCAPNDFSSDVMGTDAGWLVHSVVLRNDTLVHYKNGVEIGTATHTFDTRAKKVAVGSSLDAPPYVDVEVAAVYLYDHALSDTEWQAVETHLEWAYLGEDVNHAPIAANDSATVARGNSTTIDVLTNDDDPDVDGTLNASSVAIESAPSNGTVTVDESTGAITYRQDGSKSTADSFQYSVADDDGARSNVATVSITVTHPPTAVNDTATVTRNNSTTVDVLANDDDVDGTLNASSVVIESAPSNGTVAVNESTGAIIYRHDGSGVTTDSFRYVVTDDDGTRSNVATVSITVENISTTESPTTSAPSDGTETASPSETIAESQVRRNSR